MVTASSEMVYKEKKKVITAEEGVVEIHLLLFEVPDHLALPYQL